MSTPFNTLFEKLDAHFNKERDDDIIFVSQTEGVPQTHSVPRIKIEPFVQVMTNTYTQLMEDSDDEQPSTSQEPDAQVFFILN